MKEILAALYFGIPGGILGYQGWYKCPNVWLNSWICWIMLNPSITLSETNSEFTPENGGFPSSESPWLKGVGPIFRGTQLAVSFRFRVLSRLGKKWLVTCWLPMRPKLGRWNMHLTQPIPPHRLIMRRSDHGTNHDFSSKKKSTPFFLGTVYS